MPRSLSELRFSHSLDFSEKRRRGTNGRAKVSDGKIGRARPSRCLARYQLANELSIPCAAICTRYSFLSLSLPVSYLNVLPRFPSLVAFVQRLAFTLALCLMTPRQRENVSSHSLVAYTESRHDVLPAPAASS